MSVQLSTSLSRTSASSHPSPSAFRPISKATPAPAPILLSEEEKIIVALAQEEEYSPLKLLFLQNKAFLMNPATPPTERLQRISDQIRDLWKETMHDKEPFNPPVKITLPWLKSAQEEILDENFYRIGTLWKRRCNCLINAEKVKKWLEKDPETLKNRLISATFCKKVTLKCTFIPPKVFLLLRPDQWPTIGFRALFPNLGRAQSTPKMHLFSQIITWKSSQCSEHIQHWLDEIPKAYFNAETPQQRARYIDAIKTLLEVASRNPAISMDTSFLSCAEEYFSTVDDPLLEQFLTHIEQISDPVLGEVLVTLIKEKNIKKAIPHFWHVVIFTKDKNGKTVTRSLNNYRPSNNDFYYSKKRNAKMVKHLLEHIERVPPNFLSEAFVQAAEEMPQFIPQFLTQVGKISDDALGKALYILIKAQNYNMGVILLKHVNRTLMRSLYKNAIAAIQLYSSSIQIKAFKYLQSQFPLMFDEALAEAEERERKEKQEWPENPRSHSSPDESCSSYREDPREYWGYAVG